MSILGRVEFLCRLGSFSTTSEPTLAQVEEQIAVEYTRLENEMTRKGYEITDYPYEVIEVISYKVAAEILLGNSRNNDNVSPLGQKYMEEYKELKKDLFRSLAIVGNYFTENPDETEPDWIDEEEEW
ncbi:MAG: hypothetical protein GYA51_17845 [Candidatus Methanofastidiosa archaeon]|nr:hypothetical protein [Candidatus Methanofastidiosa archaeon]